MNKELISVVIPAYNEEKNLPFLINSLQNVFKELGTDYEIIVSNNNSTDKTIETAKKLGCKVVNESERNIGKVRNTGAKLAEGKILLFIDADSIPSEKLINGALMKLKQPNVKAVSTISSFKKYPSVMSYGVWFYNFFSKIFKLGVGQFICIKTEVFQSLNGFDETYYAFEEIDFFRRLKLKYGNKSLFISLTSIKTDSRKFEKGKADTGKFLLLLLSSVMGSDVGKDKSKMDFWYIKGHVEKFKYKKLIAIFLVLLLIFDNLFLKTDSDIRNYSHLTVPFIFSLFLILLIDNFNAFRAFLLIFCITMFIEIIGVHTGIPFGGYEYNQDHTILGILGVPIFIGFSWFIITASTYRITKKLIPMVISVVLIDIILEVFAKAEGLWTWTNPNLLFTAPIQNYISWGIIAGISFLLLKGQKISLFYATFSIVFLLFHISGILLLYGQKMGYAGFILALILVVLGLRKGVQEV